MMEVGMAIASDPRENRSASLLYRLYGRPSEIRAGHTAFNALCPIQVEDIGYWNDILVRFDPKLMDHELGWIKNRTSAIANTVKGRTSSAMLLSYFPTYPGVFKISGAIRVNSVSDGNLTISAQWTDSQNMPKTYTYPVIAKDGEFMLLPVHLASDGCMPISVIAIVDGSGTINYDASCAIEKIAA